MLLFSSDTFTVNGITVFPDHADKSQFWYLPGPVSLETMDGSTEPQFLLMMYAPDVASSGVQGVGFLNVTTALKLSDDNQASIVGKIRTQFPDVDTPLLSPVSFDEGTVQIVSLDLQGGGGTAAPPTSSATGQAVQRILGATNPELFGNNDALFALTLSEEGATILEEAFQDGMTPVGVIYNMKFTGALPALDVKITADLKRVYDSFSVDLTAQAYFASAGIDATFEKLRQDGAIKIEVVNLSTDASSNDRENWALSMFKDQILGQWFQPSLTPQSAQAADAQSVQLPPPLTGGTTPSSASAGMQAHPTGTPMGAPSGGGMNAGSNNGGSPTGARSPSMGSAGAQAAGNRPLAGGPAPTVPPPGGSVAPTSPTATPTVAGAPSPTPTATLPPITSPGVTPQAGGTPAKQPNPTPTNPIAKIPGTAAAASSAASPFGLSLRMKYVSQDELKTVEYEFNQVSAVQRTYAPQGYIGLMLQGIDQSKHFLKVDGTDPFFNKFTVQINPPKRFSDIGLLVAHVAMDYGDASSPAGVKHGEYSFDAISQTPQAWDVFAGLIQKTTFTYTADYKFDPESGWVGEQTAYTLPEVTTENRVLNLDPYDFLGFLQVSLTPGRIDASVDRIEVAMQYVAPSGWQTGTTIVVRAGAAPQYWKLRLADKDARTYTYTSTCYLKDGTVLQCQPVTSSSSAVIVSDPFAGRIDLTLQPAFDPAVYSMAIVEIAYQDAANGYNFQTSLEFGVGPATAQTAQIPIIDRAVNSYQYRITLITTTHNMQQSNYVTATDGLILVRPAS